MTDAPQPWLRNPASAGTLAAELLKDACDSALDERGSRQIEVVRDAALDLERQLEVLADSGGDGAVVVGMMAEGALRCADLSNLAACAVPELSGRASSVAVAATHVAAGATRGLCSLVEAAAGELDGQLAEYALRDARSAAWRADLVVRQVEEVSSARD